MSTQLEKASAPQRALAQAVEDGKVSMTSILSAMGIDGASPLFQAMLLVCDKYGLDPLLGHVEVLPRSKKPYITRDGFLHIAHQSHQLDGIVVEDETQTPTHWEAKVSVYRKDMNRPFTFVGRYAKAGSNKQYGPEMAVKTAERTALKRAFNVSEPMDDEHRPEEAVDTSSTVAEIEELAAVKEWVAEHGEPEAIEADVVGNDASDDDGDPQLDIET